MNDLRTKAGRFYSAFDEAAFEIWHRTGQASPHSFLAQMAGTCMKLCTRFLDSGRVDKRKASYRNLKVLEAELNSALLRYQEALDAVYNENKRGVK